jgi:hypothetical protein
MTTHPLLLISKGPSSNFVLELPSIGWQLFVLESSQSDSTAFPSCLDTYATRLLTEPLNHLLEPGSSSRSTFLIHLSAWKERSQRLAWNTREEDHIPCWANAVTTLDSFRTMDEGIAPWAEVGLT